MMTGLPLGSAIRRMNVHILANVCRAKLKLFQDVTKIHDSTYSPTQDLALLHYSTSILHARADVSPCIQFVCPIVNNRTNKLKYPAATSGIPQLHAEKS